MGSACSRNGKMRNSCRVLHRNAKRKRLLGRHSDGRVILKESLRERV
jgi:hypothetical protein